jgi:hypothetical protein
MDLPSTVSSGRTIKTTVNFSVSKKTAPGTDQWTETNFEIRPLETLSQIEQNLQRLINENSAIARSHVSQGMKIFVLWGKKSISPDFNQDTHTRLIPRMKAKTIHSLFEDAAACCEGQLGLWVRYFTY